MTDPARAALPPEARPYQGIVAGLATRMAASVIDGITVCLIMVGGYAGYAGVRLMIAPRSFRLPDISQLLTMTVFLLVALVYLTTAWWISGRTYGDHVMGIRVLDPRGTRPRLLRALARAILCVVFPIGLLWCAVSPTRRSIPDLVLRTSMVYDWLPRPPRLTHAG
jgi:uncharacterized RDD family membrane protein YckC